MPLLPQPDAGHQNMGGEGGGEGFGAGVAVGGHSLGHSHGLAVVG